MHVASSARICLTYYPSQDFFQRQVSLPWVPEVYSPVWRELRRPQADTSSEDTSGETENRVWKTSGTQGKVSLAGIFLGELSPGNAIGLTAQYLPWRGGEMSSFEIIPNACI